MPVVIPSSRAQKPVGRKVYGYISRLCLESSFPFFRSPGGAVKPPNVPCNVVYICVCVRSSNIPGGIDRISRYFTARRDKSTHLVIYIALREELRFLRNFPFFFFLRARAQFEKCTQRHAVRRHKRNTCCRQEHIDSAIYIVTRLFVAARYLV